MELELTQTKFEEVLKSDVPVVIDLWAEWCGPCKIMIPIIEELQNEYGEKAIIMKVNVDENPGITEKYNIRNIPTILFFKDGEVVDKQIGAVPKSKIVDKLNALM